MCIRDSYVTTVVWMEPGNTCLTYLCFTNITRITSRSKHFVKYPNLPSAMRPVLTVRIFPFHYTEYVTLTEDDLDTNQQHNQQNKMKT